MRVSLLDFFRTASFGGVRVGFHRDRVESMLGKPDVSLPGHSKSDDYRQAGLWVYAGVEFTFVDLDAGLLSSIAFKPSYLRMGWQYRRARSSACRREMLRSSKT